MKIIVFGATGGTGQHVVRQALRAGFEVTAFVRNPAKIDFSHDGLRVVQGDAMSREQVSAAIAGHDAVISCLGSTQGLKRSNELQEMARCIVDGMLEHGVRRIVYTASAGIDREIPGISGKLITWLLRHVLADHRAAVEHIRRQPGLIYTIVRPLGLTDRPITGQYREADPGVPPKAMSIPRADVAHFILKVLNDPRYYNTSVGIAT